MSSLRHAVHNVLQADVGPAKDCELLIVDDASLLFCEGTQQVFTLDTIATWVWIALENHEDLQLFASELCLTARINRHDGLEVVNKLLQKWADLGLLAGTEQNRIAVEPLKGDASGRQGIVRPEPSTAWASVRWYSLLSSVFRIHYGSRQIEQLVHPVLAHLECRQEDSTKALEIFLVQEEINVRIICTPNIYNSCSNVREIAPVIKSLLVSSSLDNHRYAFQIHAGAVERDGCCMLLPAEAGSGKTCLVARLIQLGWRYLSDEYAPLSVDSFSVRPLPIAMATKLGAWPVLSPYYPHIAELPIHVREDGKSIRYLPPPVSSLPPNMAGGFPIKWIVFPSFQILSGTCLTRLPRVETFGKLFRQCVSLRTVLSFELLTKITQCMETVKGYELRYSNLDEAADVLNAMVEGRPF